VRKKNTPLSIVSVHESIGVVGDIGKPRLSFAIARFQLFKGFNERSVVARQNNIQLKEEPEGSTSNWLIPQKKRLI